MEDYVRSYLEGIGAIGTDGVGQKVRVFRCQGCGRSVLRGLDGAVAAVTVTADCEPVGVLGEAVAAILGLRTYTLLPHASGTGYGRRITPRRAWHIERDSRASRRHPVVIEHSCEHTKAIPRLSEEDIAPVVRPSDEPPY